MRSACLWLWFVSITSRGYEQPLLVKIMKKPEQAAPHKGAASPSRQNPSHVEGIRFDSERRRDGLLALLSRYGITATELSRRAGMPSPNAIYNPVHGRSNGLSLDNIEGILIVFPEVTFEELVGWPRRLLVLGDLPD